MIYQVEDTETGFKLRVIGATSREPRVLRELEVEGSHSPLAEAYGLLERASHGDA